MFDDADNPALKALQEFAAARREFWANPPRGLCQEPGGCSLSDGTAILHEGHDGLQRCATHNAWQAQRKPAAGYPCDNCGKGPAFRDPSHRRDEYLCPDCHSKYDLYLPSERAMVNKTAVRMGVTHSAGRRPQCEARGQGTACKGQVKPRGTAGGRSLCDFHADPRGYMRARQE